jgi:hypothetical protein
MALTAAFGQEDEPTTMLLGAVTAMIGSWVLARIALGSFALGARPLSFAPPELTGDLKTDLAILDETDPLARLAARLDKSEGWGLDLFAIAVCLLAPLTIHWVFCLVIGTANARDFATWIRISLLLVGHAHIALAIFTARFIRRLRNPDPDKPILKVHNEWAAAFGWTLGVTCLPGILLFAVPPILSAATGIVFIPFLFLYLHSRFLDERSFIALATTAPVSAENVRVSESIVAFDQLAEATPAEEEAAVLRSLT